MWEEKEVQKYDARIVQMGLYGKKENAIANTIVNAAEKQILIVSRALAACGSAAAFCSCYYIYSLPPGQLQTHIVHDLIHKNSE